MNEQATSTSREAKTEPAQQPNAASAAPEEKAPTSKAPPAWVARYVPTPAGLVKWVKGLIAPASGLLIFVAIWAVLAPQVDTSLGALPGPVEVAEQGVALYDDFSASQEAKAAFYAAQDARNEALIAAGRAGEVQNFPYSGAPTFPGQILTSLETVALGFILATLVAVPLGLVCGLSKRVNAAINPLVQIFKPVSPLAWLPIVTMVISATMTGPDPILPKSFVISAIVVMLCSLWPTLINTAVGAASIDKDLLNVGWMVLIAAEMLAQNPGLGKFVWDEFQNGSSQSLARIMFAVLVIGFIGFLLDRVMAALQALASRNHTA